MYYIHGPSLSLAVPLKPHPDLRKPEGGSARTEKRPQRRPSLATSTSTKASVCTSSFLASSAAVL